MHQILSRRRRANHFLEWVFVRVVLVRLKTVKDSHDGIVARQWKSLELEQVLVVFVRLVGLFGFSATFNNQSLCLRIFLVE